MESLPRGDGGGHSESCLNPLELPLVAPEKELPVPVMEERGVPHGPLARGLPVPVSPAIPEPSSASPVDKPCWMVVNCLAKASRASSRRCRPLSSCAWGWG